MDTLTSFYQSGSSLPTKIALLTFYGTRYSDWSEKLLVFLEYLQLVSQSILLYPTTDDQSFSGNSDFTKAIIYFFKLINPSSLMPFHGDAITYSILVIVLCSMLLKYFLASYVFYISYRNKEGNTWLLSLWRWIFRRQGRILYFLITSFWAYAILSHSTGTFTVKGINQAAVFSVSSILIAIEFIFSFILELGFSYVLPTKNFLACKSYKISMITLNQKLAFQIVQLIFQDNFRLCLWTFTVLNLAFNLVRTYQYYTTLPLYNTRALLLQGDLLSMVTSINIACLFHNILEEADYQGENMNFIVLVWIITSVLLARVSRSYLLRQISNLLTLPSKGSVEKLLHKVYAMKQLKKWMKLPNRTKNYDIKYLVSNAGEFNIQNVFNQHNENIQDLLSNGNANQIYLQYFEGLSTKFPSALIIKLYIAKLCSKDPKLYPKAINIITKLIQNKRSKCFLSASLLQCEIEKRILKSNTENKSENTLDLVTYINTQINVDKLTKDILTQTDLKITICDNILGEKANAGLIFNNSQLIDKYKIRIKKQIDLLHQTIPSSFIELHLIYAGYSLVLNNSVMDYVKYNELYLQKRIKFEKAWNEIKLNEENLYQDTNAFLIISGEKSNKSQIVYCSQSIENICGGRQMSYNKTHISTLFTQSFQPFYGEAFRQIFEIGKDISLNQAKVVFLQHKDGYITPSELYIKVHPYLTQGFYLNMIIRPIPSRKEYLILTEDGTIEGATMTLARDLGIRHFSKSSPSHTLPNIRLLSEELGYASQAFNIIEKVQSDEKTTEQIDGPKGRSSAKDSMDYQNAMNLYTAFKDIKRVELTPLRQPASFAKENDKYSYDCTISVLPCGQAFMKLITLEKISHDETELDPEVISGNLRRSKTKNYEKEDDKESEREVSLLASEDFDSPEKVAEDNSINVFKPKNNLTTNEQLVSPGRNSTTRRFLFTSKEDDKNLETQIVKPNSQLPTTLSKKKTQIPKQMNALSSVEHITNSQSRTANTTFRTALSISFRSKSFLAICLMFYGVILITLGSQVILKVVSDDIMTTLSTKTKLLTYSQYRIYRTVLLASSDRVGMTALTADPTLNFGLVYDLPKTVLTNYNQIVFLNDFNKKIQAYTSLLDEETQHELFLQDIKMYDYEDNNFTNSSFHFVTQFQFIDEIASKVYRLKGLSNPNSTEAYHLFASIRYNILNDFFYKNEHIMEFLTDSVEQEREYLEVVIALLLIIIPILLAGIVLMVTPIIVGQYKIEKKNMLALIRLRPDSVTEILEKLKSFKKSIQSKDYSEYQQLLEIDDESSVFHQDEPQKNSRRKQDDQVINYSETRKRYYGYFIKLTVYVLILVGIMIWNFLSAERSHKVIYNKQNQIYFANRINEIVGVQYLSLEETLQNLNPAPVKHIEDTLALTLELLDELKGIQSQIPDVFLNVDRSYDPQIQAMLFNSYCGQYTFTDGVYTYYCNLVLSTGQRVNLLSLIAHHQDVMRAKIQDYYNCDKSTLNSLYTCAYVNINTYMSVSVLLIGEAFSISNTLSSKLEKSIADANHERNNFLIAFSVSLVIVSLLIWYQILVKLKEGYNDFKKVLQLFPPELILSNFMLKTFLLEYSHQTRKNRF